MMTRRRFLKALAGSAVVAGGSGIYARGFEPEWLQVDNVQASLRGVDDLPPVRIVQMSDLHASSVVPLSLIERAVETALSLQPDFAVLTGDFFTVRDRMYPELSDVLAPLAKSVPTYAVMGNHDGHSRGERFPKIRAILEAAGVELLHNRRIELTLKDRPLTLVGMGDLWTGECKPDRTLDLEVNKPEDRAPVIVLSHNPDSKSELQPYDWDLMLCGHTHGGQVKLPLIGTPFAPVEDKRYVEGLKPFDGRRIYITHGVGNLHGIRINCRPQVSLIEV